MSTMSKSNQWKPEMLSSGQASEDGMYSTPHQDMEQEELAFHIADKKTRQISRMVEALVILSVAVILIFAAYRLFNSF